MKLRIQLWGLCLLIWIQACNPGDEKSKLIARKWRVTFTTDQLLNTMSKAEREFYKLIPEDIRKKELHSIIETANDNTFEFKEDKTFEMILKGQEMHKNGTWALEKAQENYKLILTKKNPENPQIIEREELLIKELNKERLVIVLDSGSTKEILLEPVQNDKI